MLDGSVNSLTICTRKKESIENAIVVINKCASTPFSWKELNKMGFECKEIEILIKSIK